MGLCQRGSNQEHSCTLCEKVIPIRTAFWSEFPKRYHLECKDKAKDIIIATKAVEVKKKTEASIVQPDGTGWMYKNLIQVVNGFCWTEYVDSVRCFPVCLGKQEIVSESLKTKIPAESFTSLQRQVFFSLLAIADKIKDDTQPKVIHRPKMSRIDKKRLKIRQLQASLKLSKMKAA